MKGFATLESLLFQKLTAAVALHYQEHSFHTLLEKCSLFFFARSTMHCSRSSLLIGKVVVAILCAHVLSLVTSLLRREEPPAIIASTLILPWSSFLGKRDLAVTRGEVLKFMDKLTINQVCKSSEQT